MVDQEGGVEASCHQERTVEMPSRMGAGMNQMGWQLGRLGRLSKYQRVQDR